MADNTTLNAGAGGDVIASDDIGGVKFQRIKLVHGVDGTNAGDVATSNPLPVAINLPPALLTEGVELAGRTVALDSHPVLEELDPQLASQGVVFGSLDRLTAANSNSPLPLGEGQEVRASADSKVKRIVCFISTEWSHRCVWASQGFALAG